MTDRVRRTRLMSEYRCAVTLAKETVARLENAHEDVHIVRDGVMVSESRRLIEQATTLFSDLAECYMRLGEVTSDD